MLRERPATTIRDLIAAAEEGFALPSNWYTDPAIFERERAMILRRSWQFAAHTGQLVDVGDQALCGIAGAPVVLVRTAEGEIRGFVGFDATQAGLTPVQVEVWGPTVWVNLDPAAPRFAEWTNGLPGLVASHGIDVSAHVHAVERSWTIKANWKVMLDNANECYHCPTCHPSLSKVLVMDAESRRLEIAGPYRLSSESEIRPEVWASYYGIDPATLAEGEVPGYHFHWIFPTTYFQYKGRADFEVGTIEVRGIDEIGFKHMIFMAKDATPAAIAGRREVLETNPTIDEDVAICERVQTSHQADYAPAGRLLPRSEEAVQHFQKVILGLLAA